MMADPDNGDELPRVNPADLKPYASLTILQCNDLNPALAFRSLCNYMITASRRTKAPNSSVVVASGIGDVGQYLRDGGNGPGDLDEIWAFIYQRNLVPGWSQPESGYTDTENELGLVIRRNLLLAVHCNGTLRSAIQTWLDKPPRPALERVHPDILQGAFLRGEAKGLWLRGAHSPTAAKPDSKNIAGRRLQDSLNPFEDGTFALTSARAAIEPDASRVALTGTVGTTPRQSIVWNRPTADFAEFVALATEVLELVEETAASGGELERPYPILAITSDDLSAVSGAYDIVVATSSDFPVTPDADQDLIDAITILERATLSVQGLPGSADFLVEVGYDGTIGGTLRCAVVAETRGVRFQFGFEPTVNPTNGPVTREILDALEYSANLLNVYYDSGHMIDGRTIWLQEVRTMPFPNWSFLDFTGYDITKEKPCTGAPEAIHAAIGQDGDTSLFAWVVKHYSSGWLTCDDGPGEIADFIHLGPDGELSLVHVKAAESRNAARRPAVAAYEVVTSQASKNLSYLNVNALTERLLSPRIAAPATWVDGERVPDRTEMIELLQCRGARDKKRVVIVQPHISETMCAKIEASHDGDADTRRMMLLETLLNSARGPVTGLGADLIVIGSLT
jgi:hypothetical protein